MANLREIRTRLRAIANIQQITKAMELVAASRLHKAQEKALGSVTYSQKLKEIMENQLLTSNNHPFFIQHPVKKIAVIIITSDKGLCGSYNTSILREADRFLESYETQIPELVLLGRKGIDHYRGKPWHIRETAPDWGGKITRADIKKISIPLMESFLSREIDEVWIVYTSYINLFVRKVTIKKLLNIEQTEKKESSGTLDYIFEPNVEEIFDDLIPRYFINQFQTAIHQAWASELAARTLSMRQAIKNAEEMEEKLTLLRNKIRQAGITSEMAEIASGAEGLKYS